MNKTVHEVVLSDPGNPESRLPVRLETLRGLEIMPEGYGDATMMPGHGGPIFLDWYDGKLQLIVHADINQENPTHVIDLSGSLEANRKPG